MMAANQIQSEQKPSMQSDHVQHKNETSPNCNHVGVENTLGEHENQDNDENKPVKMPNGHD